MTPRFKGTQNKMIVGIKFDPESRELLTAAAVLGERTGMRLRAVHVSERMFNRGPYMGGSYYEQILGSYEYDEIVNRLFEEDTRRAKEEMHTFLASLPRPRPQESHLIESTKPAEALIADAVAQHVGLIIVSTHKTQHSFFHRGLSTAINLMVSAPMPVLIVPPGLDFTATAYRILIADDLTADGAEAARCGMDFACALGGCEVIHTHIVDFTFKDLVARVELQHDTSHATPSPSELWGIAEQRVHSQLRERADTRIPRLEAAGGRYRSQVLTGLVADEITAAAAYFKADLVVFGRSYVHQRPFGLGTIPFAAVYAQTHGVLVAPPG